MRPALRDGWRNYLHLHSWGWTFALAVPCAAMAVLLDGRSVALPVLMGAKPAPLVALPALVLAVSIGWSLTPRTAIEQLSVRPIDETGALLAVGTTLFSGSLAAMVASSTYLVDAIGSTGLLLCTAWFRRARRWGAAPSVAVFVVSAGLGGLLPGVRWWGFYLGVESPATIVFPLASLVIGMIAWSWLPDRIR